jgi:hypothetical protein
MARKAMTMERYQEIKRLLNLKVSTHDIARSMRCTRRTIREIRDGLKAQPDLSVPIPGPLWTAQVDWNEVMNEVLAGHPLKFIWEEIAQDKVSYVNFWKQFHKQFPGYKEATVVHRLFEPGERCEVDYAGKTLEWVDLKTGQIHEAVLFVGVLGFSQLIFAYAKENAQSPNFLECHNKMYAFFGGVPKVTVPDCLKQGVAKCRLYDPDINRSYQELAKHFNTAVVPARPRRPKDKAIVEGAVKLVMRYYKWLYRKHTFTSIQEINRALGNVIDRINRKAHSRFKVSRWDRWENTEKAKLNPLPTTPYEYIEWKDAKLHPDSHVSVQNCFYSAPHIHRSKTLKVKLSDRFVEIFYGLERIALHKRCRHKMGHHHTNPEHLPPNARAYHETTPQNLLSQAKFITTELRELVDRLFQENALGHLRRVQGLIRESRKVLNELGNEKGRAIVNQAIQTMRAYNKFRVHYFKELLNRYRLEALPADPHIERKPNNPMLRHTTSQPSSTLH